MMMNLFNIFDPSTSTNLCFNWISLITCFLFLPMFYWVVPSRFSMLMKSLMNYIFNEYKPLIKKNTMSVNLIISFFIFIMLNNLPGLLPYIFTATSHMSVSFMLSLSLWVGFMVHGWVFNTSNLLIHLIPNGTPVILMPFMVLVETVSNIIRPLTLAIRLSANMIAGHLLVSLLTSVTPFVPLIFYPFVLAPQIILGCLEVAVAFIQAYVFSVLVTLYVAESID